MISVCNINLMFAISFFALSHPFFLLAESTPPFWFSGKTQSRDLSALSSVDANNSETQVIWPCLQKENKEDGVKNGPSSCDPVVLDGRLKDFNTLIKRPPSSLTDVPLQQFHDMNDEATVTSLANDVQEWKKPEVGSSSCRLFGIDLMNHSKSMAIAEKAIAAPVASVSVAPVEDSDQQSGLSKASKEQKQGLDSSPKEMQSRQHGSTRSRIKVKKKKTQKLSVEHQ